MKDTGEIAGIKKRYTITLSIVFSLFILIAGYLYYRYEENRIRDEKYNELKAIADLKISQIVQWQKNRIADALTVSGSSFFIKGIEQFLQEKNNHILADEIKERLAPIKKLYGYENILLSDVNGKIQLSIDKRADQFDKTAIMKIKEAVESQQITFTDLYLFNSGSKIHFEVMAPIVNRNNETIAVLVFQIDPYAYLFPLIQTWPSKSKTAETLLLKKEGKNILFLNDLRHRKNTALKFRIPLTQTEVPAVHAALGNTGIFNGTDYSGIQVLAYVNSVPGTPWFMVAKINENEIFSELNYKAAIILILSILLLTLLWMGLAFVYNKKQKNIYRTLWEAQEEARTTLYSIGDGVLITDEKGCVKQLNPVAEQLTGWKENDARGKPLEEVFNIINEETRNKAANPINKVLRDGVIVELANHTLLISKNGTELPIADSGAPIINKDGKLIGTVLVIRDQTKERAKQKIIEQSERLLKRAQEIAHLGSWELDLNNNCLTWSDEVYRIFGLKPQEFDATYEAFLEAIYPDDREAVENAYSGSILYNKDTYEIEHRVIRKSSGEIRFVHEKCEHFRDEHGKIIRSVGMVHDITDRIQAEHTINEDRSKLEAALNSMSDAVFISDTKGKFLNFNDAFATFHKFKNKSECAKTFAEYPDILDVFFADGNLAPIGQWAVPRALRGETVTNAEYVLKRKDTGETWVGSYNFAPIRDVDGTIVGSVVTVRDISEQKKAEKELKASEARFRKTFEDSSVGIEHILPSGEWLRVNNKLCEILGYPKEELLSLNYKMITHPDDLPKVVELKQKLLYREIQSFSIEKRYLKKDKSIIWARLNCSLMEEPENNLTYIVSIIEDITDRKKIEEARLESEAKLLEAQRLAHMCSFIFNFEYNSFEWTEEFSNIYEIDHKKKFNSLTELMDLVHPGDRDYVQTSVKKAVDEKAESLEMEYRIVTGRGNLKYVNYKGKLFYDTQGKHTKRFGTIIDITERKLFEMELRKTLEELQRSNNDLEQFAYVASHDLQEPIRMINSYTELLLRRSFEKLNDDEKTFFGFISEGAVRMHGLVNALLQYSRLTSKKKEFEIVDCNEILADTLKDLSVAIKETNAIIVSEELPKVTGDKVMIRQLFQNLIHNAIKFKESHIPEISISKEKKNGYWLIGIRDNGIGIPAEYHEKIFVIFQKLHSRDKYPGTGIGLAVCKKIVELHGGQICVDSIVGKGTTFYFTLPIS